MNKRRIEGAADNTPVKPTAPNNESVLNYHKQEADSTKKSKYSTKRQEKMAERRKEIPDIHRANYEKAISGRSMKAAIKAFCLSCVCWQKEEVRLCTDLACPLYPYRPYRISKQASERRSFSPESTGTNEGRI